MPVPELIVRLESDGTYSIRLPGTQTQVPIKPGGLERTIREALHAQALGEVQKTPKGTLTLMQIKCFSEHSGSFADANCPLCRASGRFADYKSEGARTTRVPEGITGAQLAARAKAAGVQKYSKFSTKSADELGL